MEKVTLKELVSSTKGKFIFGDPGSPVLNISTDTRRIQQGDIFFALKGSNFDAHDFIVRAAEKGAGGLVITKLTREIDRFFPNIPAIVVVEDTVRALGDFAGYYRKKLSPVVIGITGSSGKTTTKELIRSILKNKAATLASSKNYNNLIGLPLTIFNLEQQHKYCILELGISIPGEMDRLAGIASPDIGIITNIGSTHLQYMKTQEQVFREKIKLLQILPENGTAVINIDDPYLAGLIKDLKCKILTYGLTENAVVRATCIRIEEEKTFFKLTLGKEVLEINMPLPGRFNVHNALSAAAACLALGIDGQSIKKGIEGCPPVEMRMERISLNSGAYLINDAYNANPESMRQAISYFSESYPGRKKILVIGDMLELGGKSEDEHRALGDFLSGIDLEEIYLCGSMIKYAKENSKLKNSQYFPEQSEILVRLKQKIDKNTVVLFKASRGMYFERFINNLVEH